ncbi:hypothetical protein [Erwinia sp. V71]|uniref:hypothetical protein n=1 Tax=Erwinia sp. V71 TaxID=3369424 RepID=UPI003F5EE7C4
MPKVYDNQQRCVAATPFQAVATPSLPGNSAVAHLSGTGNVSQKPALSWSQIAAAQLHDKPAPLSSDSSAIPSAPHAMCAAASKEAAFNRQCPKKTDGQKVTFVANTGMPMTCPAGISPPGWQRSTRYWQAQQQRGAVTRRGAVCGRGRNSRADIAMVAWRLTLPQRNPAENHASMSAQDYRELFGYWQNIKLSAYKMNLRQLNSEMGKLNQALGQALEGLCDIVMAAEEAEDQQIKLMDTFGSDVAQVMAVMGTRALNSDAHAITIAAIFNGLRALAKVGFARVSDQASVTLRTAYTAAIAVLKVCTPEQCNARMIAVCLNGLKEGGANGALLADDVATVAASSGLIGLAATEHFREPRPQNITNILNGIKTLLDYKVLKADDVKLQEASKGVLTLLCSSHFDNALPIEIANGMNGLKALLDYRVVLSDSEPMRRAALRLLALTDSVKFIVMRAQGAASSTLSAHGDAQLVANILTGLKALLDNAVLLPASHQVQQAAGTLLEIVASGAFERAGEQNIANALTALKTVLDYQLLPADSEKISAAAAQLLVLVSSPHLKAFSSQHIANSLNGIKSLLEHQILPPDDPRLCLAAEHLLEKTQQPFFRTANSQGTTNVFNVLRALLDYQVLPPEDSLAVGVTGRLMTMIAGSAFQQATAQHIANTLMGLRAILAHGVLQPDNPVLCQAVEQLMQLMASAAFAQADEQRIANGFTGFKAMLDYRVLPPDNPELRKAGYQLLRLVATQVFRNAITRTLAAQQQQAGSIALNIANVFSGLKTMLDHQVVASDDKRVGKAIREMLDLVVSGLFSEADGRNIAHVFNCLKTLVEQQVVAPQNTPLQQVVSTLVQRAACYDFADEDTQTISNIFNGISAMLESGVVATDSVTLQQTAEGLLAQVNASWYGKNDGQGIANTLNGLKRMLEYGVLQPDNKQVRGAISRLLALTTEMTSQQSTLLMQAGTQTISNIFNALKAALDYQVLLPDSKLVSKVASQLLQLTLSANFTGTVAQGISNTLNGLRALLKYKVLPPDNPQVEQVAERLLTIVALPDFTQAVVAQNITNVLNVVLTLTEQGVMPAEAPVLKAATEVLLQLGVGGALDQAPGLNIHYFFRTVMLLHQQFPQLIDNGLLQAKGKQLLKRIDALVAQGSGRDKAEILTGMLVQLQQMMSVGWVDAQRSGKLWQTLHAGALEKCSNIGQRAALFCASCRLYCAWRSNAAMDIQLLLNHIVRLANEIPWEVFHERKLAVELHLMCVELENVLEMLRKGKKGSVKRNMLAQLRPVLKTRAVPMLRHAVKLRQRTGSFDVTSREMQLFQRYLPPEQWLLPEFTPWSVEEGNQVIRHACQRLAGGPRIPDGETELRIPLVNTRGIPLKNEMKIPRERQLASSLYNILFDPQRQYSPILIETGHRDPPLFVRHGSRLYRTELLRGSVNKNGSLWGVPVEMGTFLTQQLFTSTESRVYGQRMLFPEATGNESQPAPLSPTLVGEFNVAVIPDSPSLQDFRLTGGWDILCAHDGCGFIREDLARQLLGDLYDAPRPAAGPVRAEGSLPAQSLQHYDASADECEQIASEFHLHARLQMGRPLAERSDIPTVTALASAARTGGPATYHATVVPAAGDQLLFPDTRAWRAITDQGVILTRAPHDTRNLMSIAPQHIGYAKQLDSARAIQYSLTGWLKPEVAGALPKSSFFKELLVVVPSQFWPEEYQECPIALSSLDEKIHSGFVSQDSRQQRQNAKQARKEKIRGGLVLKEVMHELVAVPYKAGTDTSDGDLPSIGWLAADYDGDLVRVLSRTVLPKLANLVARQNRTRRGNPKLGKVRFNHSKFCS